MLLLTDLLAVYSSLKLSDKPLTAASNLAPFIFFGILICLGYASVLSTIYMLATGKQYLGDRPDILAKQPE